MQFHLRDIRGVGPDGDARREVRTCPAQVFELQASGREFAAQCRSCRDRIKARLLGDLGGMCKLCVVGHRLREFMLENLPFKECARFGSRYRRCRGCGSIQRAVLLAGGNCGGTLFVLRALRMAMILVLLRVHCLEAV